MNLLDPDTLKKRLRYQGRQYSAGSVARGGAHELHYLEQAADRIQELENALSDCESDYIYLQTVTPDEKSLHKWLDRRRQSVYFTLRTVAAGRSNG